jgi:antitoxin (DNA-binding transcriptional repressor) of toxin-antitoxin stability system
VKKINMHDAKTHLSRYVNELAEGEVLMLCNRNEPVAEIRSLRAKRVAKPRIGVAKGKLVVPDTFFDPLPEDILKAFAGQ